MYKPLVSLLILLFVTSLSPYAISSSAPTTQSVQSPFYPWNNTDSHNTQISLSNTGAKNFSATFTANASDNLAIGLYSSNYNRPNGLNTNTLSAIIECVIGGWDDGSPNKANQQSCIRFENDSGNNQTQNPIFFTDTAYPHQKYIIPGSRGADITYTCTIALSDTAFKLSITYIDPTTTTQNELLSITNADMPSSIFDYLRSSTFPGFTALSFRIYTNGYTVKNYSVQLQDITATPSPNTQEEPNVTVQPYAWNDPAQQNLQIPLSKNSATKNFTATFTANPTNDFHIGLYSSSYNRAGGPNANSLGAVVECVIGGWDDGSANKGSQQCCLRFENDNANNQILPPLFFTDTATPHTKYIIPGDRGSDITYTYTTQLSASAFSLTISYTDPATNTQKPLVGITDKDLPAAIWDYLKSNEFAGFTALGFRIYNASYLVKNYTITLQNPAPIATQTQPQASTQEPSQTQPVAVVATAEAATIDTTLLAATTAATTSVSAAISALTAAQPVAQTADDTAQKVITAAQALTNKQDLVTRAQKLQNDTAQNPPSGTGPNLAYITQALSALPTTPQTYLSTEAANTAKANADTAAAAANAIATNSKAVIDSINALQQTINAQALTDASTAANQSVTTAITSLNAAQPVAQTADTKAKSAIQTARAINNQDLLAQAQKLQNDTTTNPPSGTGPNLMYITQVLAALPKTPQTYTSLDAAIAAKTNADTAKKTVDAITANNQVTLDAIAKLQTTINTGSRSSTPPATSSSPTALDTLNNTLATQLAQANKTLADTLTQAQASLTTVTQAVTNAGKLTSKNAALLQKEAAALSKTTNELITKITGLQQTASTIKPPYSKQTDANTAKTALIGMVNATKSLPLQVSANATKITSLQKSIKAAN